MAHIATSNKPVARLQGAPPLITFQPPAVRYCSHHKTRVVEPPYRQGKTCRQNASLRYDERKATAARSQNQRPGALSSFSSYSAHNMSDEDHNTTASGTVDVEPSSSLQLVATVPSSGSDNQQRTSVEDTSEHGYDNSDGTQRCRIAKRVWWMLVPLVHFLDAVTDLLRGIGLVRGLSCGGRYWGGIGDEIVACGAVLIVCSLLGLGAGLYVWWKRAPITPVKWLFVKLVIEDTVSIYINYYVSERYEESVTGLVVVTLITSAASLVLTLIWQYSKGIASVLRARRQAQGKKPPTTKNGHSQEPADDCCRLRLCERDVVTRIGQLQRLSLVVAIIATILAYWSVNVYSVGDPIYAYWGTTARATVHAAPCPTCHGMGQHIIIATGSVESTEKNQVPSIYFGLDLSSATASGPTRVLECYPMIVAGASCIAGFKMKDRLPSLYGDKDVAAILKDDDRWAWCQYTHQYANGTIINAAPCHMGGLSSDCTCSKPLFPIPPRCTTTCSISSPSPNYYYAPPDIFGCQNYSMVPGGMGPIPTYRHAALLASKGPAGQLTFFGRNCSSSALQQLQDLVELDGPRLWWGFCSPRDIV